jgi:hypothetical protein
MQFVDLGFFNITSLNNIVEISKYYIPQKPVLFEIGDEIELEYVESNKVIILITLLKKAIIDLGTMMTTTR